MNTTSEGLTFGQEAEIFEMYKPRYKTPFKCPVCDGKGIVPHGFYSLFPDSYGISTSFMPETCKSCAGSGIVWG